MSIGGIKIKQEMYYNTKQCPYCHNTIALSSQHCPYCGRWLIYQMPYYQASPRPRTRMTESLVLGIASLVCCTIWALPFAIVSYVKSKDSEKLWTEGKIYEAHTAAKKAEINYKIGLWVAIFPIIIGLMALVICVILGLWGDILNL